MRLLLQPLIWRCGMCGRQAFYGDDAELCDHDMEQIWEDAYGTHGGDCRYCGMGPM